MKQPDLFLKDGEAAAVDGMQRAVDHADDVEALWSTKAFGSLMAYAWAQTQPFLIEDARLWAHRHDGLPLPPDGRAWGAVVRKAARSRFIKRVGTGNAQSSNNSPKCLWVARHD